MAQIQQAPRQLLPFRDNTRQRVHQVGTFRINQFGQSLHIPLPQVGYIAAIMIRVEGNAQFSAAGSFIPAGRGTVAPPIGPWNLLRRLRYGVNLGNTVIYDTSGVGNLAYMHTVNRGVSPEQVSTFTANVGANTWKLVYYIPVSANNGENFELGLINLQAQEVRSTLSLQVGTAAEIATNLTAIDMEVEVGYIFYDVPSPLYVKQPPFILHRILEDSQPINSVGDVSYIVPSAGVLLRLIHGIQMNGSSHPHDFTRSRIRLNRVDENYDMTDSQHRMLALYRYGHLMPHGFYVWDFWNAHGQPGSGDLRDAYDLEKVTTFESVTTINTAVALGTGNNHLISIREILQQVSM